MIAVPLELRYSPAHQAAPAAWLISGGDPELWLEEIVRWEIPMSEIRLMGLPASAGDRRCAGVLAISKEKPRTAPRAYPFASRAEKLFLPADAQLFPNVSDEELKAALPFELQILHPALGLIGFSSTEILDVAGLICVAPESNRKVCRWRQPEPGVALYPRLVSVEPDAPLSLDAFMKNARGDIGSTPIKDTPKAPGELPAALEKIMLLGTSTMLGAANALSEIGRLVPGLGMGGGWTGGQGPAWLQSLQNWSASQIEALSRRLESLRSRELDRLLHMLETDPESALRFAIPLSGAGARGLSAPGARLVARDTNFRLGGLRGGQAADPWNISAETQRKLRERYIAAANRELALGRHRRAAYIFAQLLNDFSSAASALKQGRHFREAAAIYREHLKNPRFAADCLKDGGLLLEAIEIYESLQLHLIVAGLYTTLERHDEAQKAYRKAVDYYLLHGDRMSAAKILEVNLAAPDEALAMLREGWPDSKQAQQCLLESFALSGRLGRHEASAKYIVSLRAGGGEARQCPPSRSLPCVETLAILTESYPDAPVRLVAADAARVIAGRRMLEHPLAFDPAPNETQFLVQAVLQLNPEDRLLARDCKRFAAMAQKPAVTQKNALPIVSGKSPKVKCISDFKLPGGVRWIAAAASDAFYAAGYGTMKLGTATDLPTLAVLKCLWNAGSQTLNWNHPIKQGLRILLAPPRHDDSPLVVALSSGWRPPDTQNMVFTAGGDFEHNRVVSFTPLQSSPPLGICYDEHDVMYIIIEDDGEFILRAYSKEMALPSSVLMDRQNPRRDWYSAAAQNPGAPLVVRQGVAYAAIDDSIVTQRGRISMRKPVLALAASAPFTRTRIAVAFDEGGEVLWPNYNGIGARMPFGDGLFSPKIGFARNGSLIAAAKDQIRVYNTDDGLLHESTFPAPGPPPVAVVAGEKINEFATLWEDGRVHVFTIQ